MNLDNIKIVLVGTTHPGNIGAAARAMKNMGLSRLCLVNPKIFPHVGATARAAGADDLLAEAKVFSSLEAAIADCKLVIGTSARVRELSHKLVLPKEAAQCALKEADSAVAIIFGRESSGLTNAELNLCHYHLHIPTKEKFSSLNLAAAVQVVVYELFAASQNFVMPKSQAEEYASAEEMQAFYQHLHEVLTEINFLKTAHPKKMQQRLHRLFNRARLEKTEVNILRGILSSIQSYIKNKV